MGNVGCTCMYEVSEGCMYEECTFSTEFQEGNLLNNVGL